MAKKNNTDYSKVCLYCENATVLQGENTVLCKYKGVVSEDYVCRKFVYDPLKREVRAAHGFVPLDPDALLMD